MKRSEWRYSPYVIGGVLVLLTFVLRIGLMPLGAQPRVASVQVRVSGSTEYRPIPYYMLGSGEGLEVEFDLLDSDAPTLCYSLSLYNADGSNAQLAPIEYAEGFAPADFDAGQPSRGTLVSYVHYSLSLPNDRLSPSSSGSYRLSIATTDAPSDPILVVPFAVLDPLVRVKATASAETRVDHRLSHQQVNVELGVESIDVYDPQSEITVQVYRNGCMEDVQTVRKPSAIMARKLVYAYEGGALFAAGNEYHRFEALGTRTGGMGVSHTELLSQGYYHLYLYADKVRAGLPYVYDADHDGLQVIRSVDSGAENASVSADYHLVRFTLKGLNPLSLGDGQLRLAGDAFRYLPQSQRLLKYSAEDGAFVADVLLKQGYVEYIYQAVAGQKPFDPNLVSGNHYQTSNTYTVLVYHRGIGGTHDRLVGACVIQ